MRSTLVLSIAIVVLLSVTPTTAMAQAGTASDISGLWVGAGSAGNSPNLERLEGELPFTDYGRERYMTFDHALNNGARCLPLGPTRTWQVNYPFRIMQTPELVLIAYELRRTFRIIYTDGREHPEIIFNYPEWMGHSVGSYEDGTLVFESVGINPRTDIDNAGHEHSDQLRLVERIRKTDQGTLDWEVTIEDPVFYTEPFTLSKTFDPVENDRVMDYTCTENERDVDHLVPGVAVGPQ